MKENITKAGDPLGSVLRSMMLLLAALAVMGLCLGGCNKEPCDPQ